MAQLEIMKYEDASVEAKSLFDGIKKKLGRVPNIYATIGHSPVALKAVLDFGDALKGGEFKDQEVEAVALSIAQENDCGYCLAAHTAIAKMSGLTEEQTIQMRTGTVTDEKLKALTSLAKEIVVTRGRPSQATLDEFFAVGYSQAALVELVALVALNTFTNYFNHITEPVIDFPAYKV